MTSKILLLGTTCLLSGLFGWSQDYEFLPRERLGDHINTTFTETKPIISYDNSVLFLTRQYHPMNTGGEEDIQDIYYANRDMDRIWSEPINMGAPLNNNFPNGISSLSLGADTALVINVFNKKGYEKGASLSFKGEGGWSAPKGININKFRNDSDFVDYFISNDGKRMFLAIDTKGSFGDQDIYVSEKIDDFNWTEPRNIGEGVNTVEAEFSPFLSADGETLFFSSFGHEGFGGADIYYSKRLDDTWLNWSPAKNLGDRFNTEGFEAYFTIPARGEHAYFVSDVESNAESRDIFRAIIPLELNPTPGVIVSGITRNQITKAAITANVDVTTPDPLVEDKQFLTDNADHKYSRSIFEFPKKFRLLAEQTNFMTTSQYLLVEAKDKREIKADLYLVPIAVGNTLVSHDVLFDPGSARLAELGEAELNRMVKYLQDYDIIKFEIVVHVEAGEGDDQELSEQRLATIHQYFLDKGVSDRRVIAKAALGSTVPFQNTDKILVFDPEKPNNRVAFTIVSDRDEDLVRDEEDKCPDEAGIEENGGCAPLSEETLAVFEEALQGIQFETAKDVIKAVSYPILDNVVEIMIDNPSYFLKIEGHTDSDGSEASNQDLSERRAAATLKYLVDKGVAVVRLKDYGFGETKPVASNDTNEGKAQNRRVVFEVVFDSAEL